MVWLAGANIDTRPIKTQKDQLSAYVGWCYAAASKISNDVRSNPWTLWDKNGKPTKDDWEAVPREKINPILVRPNATMLFADLIEVTQLHLDLAGETMWHKITASEQGGKIIGLEVIYPHWLHEPVQNPQTGQISAWKVMVPGRELRTINVEDLLHIKYPHPLDPIRGCSPVEAFALSHDLDMYSRAYGGALMKNRATPELVLTSEQELTREQMDVIRDQWMDRHTNPASGPGVLGKGATIQQLSLNMADLQFLAVTQATREQILGAYGVPAAKLGLITDANRANSEAADYTYKENCIFPRLNRIEAAINFIVLPWIYGKDASRLYFGFQSPIDEDRDFILKESMALFDAGVITVDELRATSDRDAIGGASGALYKISPGAKYVPDLAKAAEEAKALAEEKAKQPIDPKAPPPTRDPEQDEVLIERIKKVVGDQLSKSDREVPRRTSAINKEDVERRFLQAQGRLEQSMQRALAKQFQAEKAKVVAAIPETRAVSGEKRDWIDSVMEQLSAQWRGIFNDYILRGYNEGWLQLSAEVSQTVSWSVYRDEAASIAREQAGAKVVGIQQTTVDEIRTLLGKAVEEGWSPDKLAGEIGNLYDGFSDARSMTIARTEMTSAMNAGKEAHAEAVEQQYDIKLDKTWIATDDDRTRETHVDADGQTVTREESFDVGGASLDFPGDPSGPPEEIINCRCTMAYQERGQ